MIKKEHYKIFEAEELKVKETGKLNSKSKLLL